MRLMPIIPVIFIIIAAVALVAMTVFCIVNKKYRHFRYFRRIIAAFLILAIFARPMVGTSKAEREVNNINVFFVVDNTGSMATRDMDNFSRFRYEVLADDMKKIAEKLAGSKFSVVSLDYTTYRAVPLVSDANAIISYADSLMPKDSYRSHDSDLSELLKKSLESIRAYNERFPDRESILIFMSDGEDNALGSITVPDEFKGELSGGAVIGYGTKEGAHVNEVFRGEIMDSYIRNLSQPDIISKLNPDNLNSVATKLSLPYYERNRDDNFLNYRDNFLKQTTNNTEKVDTTTMFDLYWIIAIFLAGLVFWDFLDILNRLLLERRVVK